MGTIRIVLTMEEKPLPANLVQLTVSYHMEEEGKIATETIKFAKSLEKTIAKAINDKQTTP